MSFAPASPSSAVPRLPTNPPALPTIAATKLVLEGWSPVSAQPGRVTVETSQEVTDSLRATVGSAYPQHVATFRCVPSVELQERQLRTHQ